MLGHKSLLLGLVKERLVVGYQFLTALFKLLSIGLIELLVLWINLSQALGDDLSFLCDFYRIQPSMRIIQVLGFFSLTSIDIL